MKLFDVAELVRDIDETRAAVDALEERAFVAAQYRLACSPHEWTDADSLAMAEYVFAVMAWRGAEALAASAAETVKAPTRRWPNDNEILDALSASQVKPTWMVRAALARPRPPEAWLLGRLAALYTAGLVQLEWIGHGRCWSRVL